MTEQFRFYLAVEFDDESAFPDDLVGGAVSKRGDDVAITIEVVDETAIEVAQSLAERAIAVTKITSSVREGSGNSPAKLIGAVLGAEDELMLDRTRIDFGEATSCNFIPENQPTMVSSKPRGKVSAVRDRLVVHDLIMDVLESDCSCVRIPVFVKGRESTEYFSPGFEENESVLAKSSFGLLRCNQCASPLVHQSGILLGTDERDELDSPLVDSTILGHPQSGARSVVIPSQELENWQSWIGRGANYCPVFSTQSGCGKILRDSLNILNLPSSNM